LNYALQNTQNKLNLYCIMIKGFWGKIKKPFFVLAPMYDVTDAPFRKIIAKYSKKGKNGVDYVTFTEFVSADGLCSDKGKTKLLKHLKFSVKERPIVAQIFGANPDNIREAAKLMQKLGFDGVDINMGCPDKAVIKQGAGAALIKNPRLALGIIAAAQAGADKIPVSVKTRVGYDKIDTEKWIGALLEAKPAAITIHGRAKKEMSLAPTHWDEIKKAAELAKKIPKKQRPIIIGNGDITSIKDGEEKVAACGVDGIMIGRGIFGKPWLFSGKKDFNLNKKLEILIEHTKLFEKIYKSNHENKLKNFNVMKKHFKAYITGSKDAKELRIKLMKARDASETEKIIRKHCRFL